MDPCLLQFDKGFHLLMIPDVMKMVQAAGGYENGYF